MKEAVISPREMGRSGGTPTTMTKTAVKVAMSPICSLNLKTLKSNNFLTGFCVN